MTQVIFNDLFVPLDLQWQPLDLPPQHQYLPWLCLVLHLVAEHSLQCHEGLQWQLRLEMVVKLHLSDMQHQHLPAVFEQWPRFFFLLVLYQ